MREATARALEVLDEVLQGDVGATSDYPRQPRAEIGLGQPAAPLKKDMEKAARGGVKCAELEPAKGLNLVSPNIPKKPGHFSYSCTPSQNSRTAARLLNARKRDDCIHL